MESSWKLNEPGLKRISYLIGYLENESLTKSMIGISGSSYEFTTMSAELKTSYLKRLTRHLHFSRPDTKNNNYFHSGLGPSYAVLMHVLSQNIIRYMNRIMRLFVPKFYHDRSDKNFLKGLLSVGEKREIDENFFSEIPLLGRKLYEYRIWNNNIVNFNPKDLNWSFPAKYYQSIGYTVHGFSFKFKNTDNNLSAILNPNDDLINIESGVENANNNLIEELFSNKKTIEQKIAECNAIPIKNFINESFFLYDRSNAIKKTFVTTIDKELSIYGSFSYFSGKIYIKNIKLIDVTNPLKFLVEKKSLKDNLKLKIAYVNNSDVNTEDKKNSWFFNH